MSVASRRSASAIRVASLAQVSYSRRDEFFVHALDAIARTPRAIGVLPPAGVQVTPGLAPDEFRRIEDEFQIMFPPDLRALLSVGVPLGPGFPDWRSGSRDVIRELLDAPAQGILFDVDANSFWFAGWGSRPRELGDALEAARTHLADAPTLVPIYSHRYIPSQPDEAGNPVFSVVQTDIVVYGNDLASYLSAEFGAPAAPSNAAAPKRIPFWSELVDFNNQMTPPN